MTLGILSAAAAIGSIGKDLIDVAKSGFVANLNAWHIMGWLGMAGLTVFAALVIKERLDRHWRAIDEHFKFIERTITESVVLGKVRPLEDKVRELERKVFTPPQ